MKTFVFNSFLVLRTIFGVPKIVHFSKMINCLSTSELVSLEIREVRIFVGSGIGIGNCTDEVDNLKI